MNTSNAASYTVEVLSASPGWKLAVQFEDPEPQPAPEPQPEPEPEPEGE